MSLADPFAISGLAPFWRHIRGFIREERRIYGVASLFEVLSLGTVVLYPQLIRSIIDEGIQKGSMDRVNSLAIVMAVILALQALSTYLRALLFEVASQRVVSRMRCWVFGNLLRQEIAFFDARTTGELSARLSADAGRIGVMTRDLIPDVVHFGSMGAIAGALMVYTSPRLSLVVVMVAPVIWILTSRLGSVMRRRAIRTQASNARVASTALETIASMLAVRSHHAEQDELDRYRDATGSWMKAATHQAKASSILRSMNDLLSESAVLLALWAGGYLIVGGSLSPGAVVSFVLYAGMVMSALRNVSRAGAELLRTQGATAEVFRLGERQTQMAIDGGIVPERIEGTLELDDVHFRYRARPEPAALRGVSLRIPRGTVLALVGASGSGKSTLARLMARVYDPDQGRILLDGRDLRELSPAWLRRQIAWVPAEAILFARSLSENIRFGCRGASDAEVEQAAQQVCADEFIRALPEGYDSDAGEQGRLLSGGQRQRIAIARALLGQPAILILDEATAALDAETELLVKEGLRKLPHHPSIVIVSHRLSTIVDADRVVLVHAGRVVAEGTHPQLLASNPAYRDLVENQLVHG